MKKSALSLWNTGPVSLPVLGGTWDIFRASVTKSYLSFQNMKRKYGDIFHIKLGVVSAGKANFDGFQIKTGTLV
jgi:hypothetical protein